MKNAIRFAGTCPTCGRSLHIPIELYGKPVCCHGCGAEFRAASTREHAATCEISSIGEVQEIGSVTQRSNLDSRVDSLLAAADRQLDLAHVHPAGSMGATGNIGQVTF
ncbi:MAG: hypothetical protein MUF23_14455 [Pirellula sp.]|jgi:hypothetical protein|nr:hypothetical protein [Pirellula sp.]